MQVYIIWEKEGDSDKLIVGAYLNEDKADAAMSKLARLDNFVQREVEAVEVLDSK